MTTSALPATTPTPTHTPLLSIVTVCFNSEATVRETLRSVDAALASTPVGLVEHLILDGASRDGTLDIVAAHRAPYRRLLSERDKGIYDAMNKGLRLATGRYVWFLNSDDLLDASAAQWMPSLLQLLHNDRWSVIVGEIRMFRDAEGQRLVTRRWKLPRDLGRARRLGWHPPHPAFIARRTMLLELGAFDERKRIAADYKLMLSAIDSAGGQAGGFPHNLTMMREGGTSNGSVRAILKANAECYAAHRELGRGRVGAGLGIVLKLSRKVFQRLEGSTRKVTA